MLGTFLASDFAKPLYRSAIQIQIERENPNQLTVDDLFGIAASDQEFLQTQYVLLKSRGLAEKVIDDQKLLSDPEFHPAGITGKTPAQIAEIRQRDGRQRQRAAGSQRGSGTRRWSTSPTSSPSPRLAQKIAEGEGSCTSASITRRKSSPSGRPAIFSNARSRRSARQISQSHPPAVAAVRREQRHHHRRVTPTAFRFSA